MSLIATDIKDLFTLKPKPRTDHFTDQYNRVFMVKLLLACTMIAGINWYADEMNCQVPDTMKDAEEFLKFAQKTCWIQGLYVYKDLWKQPLKEAYYGITKDIATDGLDNNGRLCRTKTLFWEEKKFCQPFEKTYFLQYQWLPFYLCALTILYYMPYMLHRKVNSDLIELKEKIEKKELDSAKLIAKYFKEEKVRRCSLFCCLNFTRIGSLVVKILYILANAFSLFSTHNLMNHEYYYYGLSWITWGGQNHTLQYDYTGLSNTPRPGNKLLPPIGYCELYSQSKHLTMNHYDHHKLLCEMSQNVLYQHAFVLLWFAKVVGLVVSCLGLLYLICYYILTSCVLCQRHRLNSVARKLYKKLTYRQIEYIELLRSHDFLVYSEVFQKLSQERLSNVALR